MNMGNYIIKRILTGIFSLFVLITVTFFLTRSMPGSPFQSSNISPNMVETMEKEVFQALNELSEYDPEKIDNEKFYDDDDDEEDE